MRVINIVDDLRQVNLGVWGAATITGPWLKTHSSTESHIWFPASSAPDPLPDLNDVRPRALTSTATSAIPRIIKELGLSPTDTLISTHGSWRYPTRWGHALKKLGYKWVYAPQGMLEPWGMAQKALKKWIYFEFVESRLVRHADVVRAVSLPECGNLSRHFKRVEMIPNAVMPRHIDMSRRLQNTKNTVLFMARLHHKKGAVPLTQAWLRSPLSARPDWQLRIAGPDDGDLCKIKALLEQASNIQYLGPIYGEQKLHELENAHFYILPSMSEGFPTSVVEAMQAGLIPVLSEGSNFPEVFRAGLGIKISQDMNEIVKSLIDMAALPTDKRIELSCACARFIEAGYLVEHIGRLQHDLFTGLLAS